MESNLSKFKNELERLVAEANDLRLRMALDLSLVDATTRKKIEELKLPPFKENYERWYTLALRVVKQLLPDRVDDFVKQYKNEKRKETDFLTYGLSDYMIGLQTKRGIEVVVDGKAAFPKFEQQLNILKSAQARLESSLYDMVEILQAHVFDDELEAAKELNIKGFFRGAGAIAGVVLERHLTNVCGKHKLGAGKKRPTINDLNQVLKDAGTIDTATWRFIQHLGDMRNLCDHSGSKEPDRAQIDDLIAGVAKVTKTVF